ncbi:MAG TPA: FAD-dependent oxidoreductase [Kofleriaceae bacterium]|nr:FAD-dependent oxidoreductase [Kofleriaceae bacterium]
MRRIANDSGARTSVWMDVEVPSFDTPVVSGSHTEVCVIGAGIAGVSIAHELVRRGADVIVVDDGPIAGGETARTSAHVSNALDDRFHWLESRHGTEAARIAAQSHAAAIDLIEDNAAMIGLDCEFARIDGWLVPASDRDHGELERELAAAIRCGVAVEKLDSPFPFHRGAALRFRDQARFQPVAYVRGLAAAIIAQGGQIHCGLHVDAIEPGRPLGVRLRGGGVIWAKHVVDATNATITSMVRFPIRQAPYRTYVIAIEIAPGSTLDALLWDTADPYHYVRLAGDRLIVGGEDHRTGHGSDPSYHWNALEEWTRQRYPETGEVVARWSGQCMEPADGLAFIGKNPDLEGVYVVTGDSGNGLTHATIGSMIIPALIEGRDHPYAALYDPGRSTLRSVSTIVREALSSNYPYLDWIGRGDVTDPVDIARGEGAVIRRGVHLIAAYRDPHGVLHECSARCPHLSGVVSWNAAEKTWDCPCHGSRFDPLGRVLNPPAVSDLPAAPAHDEKPQPTEPRTPTERRPRHVR